MSGMQIPAWLKDKKPSNIAERTMQGLGGQQPPHVSLAGGKFRLVDSAGNAKSITEVFVKDGREVSVDVPYLDCVIVDGNENVSRVYYQGEYDPNTNLPPTCWSDNGRAPSVNAQFPQNETCTTCKWAVWGSATSRISNKPVPACKSVKKLAILVPGEDMPFLLRVPPASTGALKEYAASVGGFSLGSRKADVSDLVTRVTFLEGQGVTGVLQFAPKDWITEDMYADIQELCTEEKTSALVGRNDVPRQGVLAAPVNQPALAAPQQEQPKTVLTFPLHRTDTSAQEAQEPVESHRRRRRTKAEMEAERAQAPSQQTAQPEPQPQAKFGVVENPAKPDAAMSKVLQEAFGLPTRK